MPLRNLAALFLACVISYACYLRADRNRYCTTLAQAMNLVTDNYLEPVEYRELYENAMRGMVDGLDPYSDYIGPDEYGHFIESLDQEFGGVGIMVEISPETNRLTVLTPLIDTPAYRAGLKAGDTVLSIDGQDTEGMSLQDAVKLMRGRPNEPVRLSILHVGAEKPVDVVIRRAVIPLESVLGDQRRRDGSWIFSLTEDPQITYIRVITFGERTVEELTETIEDLEVKALILDLRDNAGGLLTAAVGTCDLFIDDGLIVSTRGRDGETFRTFSAKSSTLLDRDVPVVVLINGFTASASEIVAACLQDHSRVKVIGERTWGKGTVQNVIEVEGGRAALKLTTASYWRPSGRNIHRVSDASEDDDWGVQPDKGFEVPLTPEEADHVRRDRRKRDGFHIDSDAAQDPDVPDEDPDEFFDPQLKKAIDYLRQQLDAPAT